MVKPLRSTATGFLWPVSRRSRPPGRLSAQKALAIGKTAKKEELSNPDIKESLGAVTASYPRAAGMASARAQPRLLSLRRARSVSAAARAQ